MVVLRPDQTSVDDRESSLLRGALDMCVLSLLAHEPLHAYGVVKHLQDRGFVRTSYGTVYPLVTRLRRLGLVEQVSQSSAQGPARNVLNLTRRGHQHLEAWSRQWRDVQERVAALLDEPHDPATIAVLRPSSCVPSKGVRHD